MVVLLVHLEAGDGDLDGCIGELGLAFQYIFDREIASSSFAAKSTLMFSLVDFR